MADDDSGHDLDAVLAEYDQIILSLTRQLIAARLEIRRLTAADTNP